MKIDVIDQDNLLMVGILDENLVFYKSNLNCIFIKSNRIHHIVIYNLKNLRQYEKLYLDADYTILFSYGYIGNPDIIEYFYKYKFLFMEFIELDFFWYGILKDGFIYEEQFIPRIESNYVINLETNKKYLEIELEMKQIEEDIEKFKSQIYEDNLQEIENRKKLLFNNFEGLNLYILDIKKSFRELYSILHKKLASLKKMEEDRLQKVNITLRNEKPNKDLEEKNKYLLKLLNYIEDLEKKKQNSLQGLNKVNQIKNNKEKNIYNLQKEIEQLKLEKQKISQENIKLPNVVNKKSNIKPSKIAICIHLFNYHLYDEFVNYLKIFIKCGVSFDMYVNLAVNHKNDLNSNQVKKFIQKLQQQTLTPNLYFTVSDNRGMDIGGFLQSYLKMLELKLTYDSIIKIHSKTNNNWRFAMLYALLGNEKIIKSNLELIQKPEVGMIGNQIINLKHSTNHNLYPYIKQYMQIFKVSKLDGGFIPGTIFWIKGCVLEKYFNITNLKQCYSQFQQNYCGLTHNKREGKPHAFERFCDILVENCGLQTVRFDS